MAAPKNKRKKTLIILGIIIAVLAVVCGVIAVIASRSPKTILGTPDMEESLTVSITTVVGQNMQPINMEPGKPIQMKSSGRKDNEQPPYEPGAPQSRWPSTLFRTTLDQNATEMVNLVYKKQGYTLWKTNRAKWNARMNRIAMPDLVRWAHEKWAAVNSTPRDTLFPEAEWVVRECGYTDCIYDVSTSDRPYQKVGSEQFQYRDSWYIKQFNADPKNWKFTKRQETIWKKP